MRYTLTLLLLLLALCGNAQEIHFDSTAQMSYVNITPVKAKFNDTVNCTRLYVRLFNDNLQTECSLYYELRDNAGAVYFTGKDTIGGDDYSGWDGNNEYPFEFEAGLLGLTTHD